jgi:hypothetical protein
MCVYLFGCEFVCWDVWLCVGMSVCLIGCEFVFLEGEYGMSIS